MPHENTSDCPTEKEQLRRLKEIVGASLQTRSQLCLARRGLYSRERRIFEGISLSFSLSFFLSFFLGCEPKGEETHKVHTNARISGDPRREERKAQEDAAEENPSSLHGNEIPVSSLHQEMCRGERRGGPRVQKHTARGDGVPFFWTTSSSSAPAIAGRTARKPKTGVAAGQDTFPAAAFSVDWVHRSCAGATVARKV